jgi:aerobic C4-dicarboxylate transport protein
MVAQQSAKAKRLYILVLVGVALGVLLGWLAPDVGKQMRPLADGFINLIKMLIGPVIFCTIVHGIASVGGLRAAGRIGLKALIYFELVTTLSLLIGLGVVNWLQPGAGIHQDPAALDANLVKSKVEAAEHMGVVPFLLGLIPRTFVSAFTEGEILQVVLIALLTGAALSSMGEQGKPLADLIDRIGALMFRIIAMVMVLAPIAAFGAMAYTVSELGAKALTTLAKLMGGFYLTCLLFVFFVLGPILRLCCGLSLWRLLVYLRQELLLVLGTSSSEPALPDLMRKLKHLGCRDSVVGLVIPTGYSFNLDGTSIYMTMAALYVAQALDMPLSWSEQIGLLVVMMLTSKGAAAVTGGGFVVLAASLEAVGKVPVAGLVLVQGIDRFMSEARALTNMIGNSVATLVVARWEGALDVDRARRILAGEKADPVDPMAGEGSQEGLG